MIDKKLDGIVKRLLDIESDLIWGVRAADNIIDVVDKNCALIREIVSELLKSE